MPGLVAANVRDALQRCRMYVESHGQVKPSQSDWETWERVNQQLGIT